MTKKRKRVFTQKKQRNQREKKQKVSRTKEEDEEEVEKKVVANQSRPTIGKFNKAPKNWVHRQAHPSDYIPFSKLKFSKKTKKDKDEKYSDKFLGQILKENARKKGFPGWPSERVLYCKDAKQFLKKILKRKWLKRGAKEVNAAINGKMPSSNVKRDNQSQISTMGQFFHFVYLCEGDKVEFGMRLFAKPKFLKGFIRLMELHDVVANTVQNKCIYLKQALKWMLSQKKYKNQWDTIFRLNSWLSSMRAPYRAIAKYEQSLRKNQKQLLKDRKSLTVEEFQQLHEWSTKRLLQCLNDFCTLKEQKQTEEVKLALKNKGHEIQNVLLLLVTYILGGQRQQVGSKLSLYNIVTVDKNHMVLHPGYEKTTRRSAGEGLPIPQYLQMPLTFFKKEVRAYLQPEDHVECLWIDIQGKALSEKAFSQRVGKVMTQWNPQVRITPANFRRTIPTLIAECHLVLGGKSFDEGIKKYADLINTSEEILYKYYNRETITASNQVIQENIADGLWRNESSMEQEKNLRKWLRDRRRMEKELVVVEEDEELVEKENESEKKEGNGKEEESDDEEKKSEEKEKKGSEEKEEESEEEEDESEAEKDSSYYSVLALHQRIELLEKEVNELKKENALLQANRR